ncbi:MAG: purine-nucleoside phosphorylase, partial [Verrucomicrobiota bacterium]|nr:purine-nucleoside phosphorylase [Verrucomicrobiota bacterium]
MGSAPLQELRDWGAEIALVLGSGLSSLVDQLSANTRFPYSNFDELPRPAVPGHAGQFALGSINGTRVICALGRVHAYEGYAAREVTAGIRLLARCGIKHLILTNAAGATNPAFASGGWMMIEDHLNLTGATPLLGAPSFVDMTEAYSAAWRARFASAAQEAGVRLHTGVYAGVPGPQYETPAEVRMLRTMGADAIGMSTVLETIQARALGLEVAGFSCLTNWAAGITGQHLSHAHVLASGEAAAADFA